MFAIGGNGGTKAQQKMKMYDTTTKTWTKQDSSLNQNAWMHCVAHLSSNVVVMGGYDSACLTSTEVLDVTTTSWTTGPNLPVAVYYNRGVTSETGNYLGFSTGGSIFGGKSIKIYGLKETNRCIQSSRSLPRLSEA